MYLESINTADFMSGIETKPILRVGGWGDAAAQYSSKTCKRNILKEVPLSSAFQKEYVREIKNYICKSASVAKHPEVRSSRKVRNAALYRSARPDFRITIHQCYGNNR